MFVVGLTGGIGSGKTAVSDHLASFGIEVVDADVISRIVVEPGQPALSEIAEKFGSNILLADGNLNRALLREKIFNNPDDKQWLESLLHPLIATELFRQLEAAKSAYVLFVSPLLVESGQDAICDRLIVVDVSEQVQLERTIERDNNSAEQVKNIIASQASREQRLDKATDVIENNADLHALHQKTQRLHQQLLTLAAEKKQLEKS